MIVYTDETKELVEYLVAKDYAVIVDNKPILTKKFKDLFIDPITVEESVMKQVNTVLAKPKVKVSFPSQKKDEWTKLVELTGIPHGVSTLTGTYTVKQYTDPAANVLVQIVNNPNIDYDIFIASVKHYYQTVTFKVTLANYLTKGLWKDEYDEYVRNKGKSTNDGGSIWED